ncbi:MAG: hypothetical protein KGJ23_04150 [Euryarchaeota archaeon]|nr:hypothetical protein [Euryarchaeota archaeon]MDE1835791.1 hypothetical protein [Euryarchaeota archaeon]MDE1880735.1 hypothetical protein [Euryarchaeota archaeon]MDE2043982.1 hypothetical protein [Thermoplasmata archaeon]
MSDKARAPPRSHENVSTPSGKGTKVPVSCGMEGCDHSAALHFQGETPYEGFTFDTTGWTVVEDTEDHRTVFLCSDCTKEFEEEASGGEDDDDLDDDDEDETDGP